MDRREYVKAAGAAVTGSVLAGCAASSAEDPTGGDDTSGDEAGGTGTGTLSTSVTDRPVDIDDFESCVVTIEGIWVKPEGAGEPDGEDDESAESDGDEPDDEGSDGGGTAEEDDEEPEDGEDDGSGPNGEPDDHADESEGRRYVEFEGSQEADLVQLQGADTQLIDETELPADGYQFLQLDVSGVKGTLAGGGDADVETPGNAPLQFKQSFEIRAGDRTRFVADFAPIRRGQGDYLLRPVATGTQVLYGDEEYDPETGDEGSEPEDGEGNTAGDDRDNGSDDNGTPDDAADGPPDDAGN